MRSFLEFVEQKKSNGDEPITSKVNLGDGNDFQPLVISDDPNSEHYGKNKSLAPIVRAFKKGANWGWSRDDNTGEDKPVKVGSKKLYLTGGALRDHLTGKKARNHELVTNSSPDEVFNILKQNNFEFVGDKDPGEKSDLKKNCFWVISKDKRGRPFTFGIRVKGDVFELSVFTKTTKGKEGKELEPGTHADDASGRDFTINSMYLALSNDNGPNKDLNDFYGGMHHLKNGRIASVGDLGKKLKEDPMRALRYIRMLSRYGDSKKVPEEEKNAVRGAAEHMNAVDPKDAMEEFMKGLNYDDVDSRSYLSNYNDLGLLGFLFPGLQPDANMPTELRELGDKHAPIAWMLRKHDPKAIETNLSTNWKPEDLKKILLLVNGLKLDQNIDPDSLDSLVKNYVSSGVSGRKFKQWLTKLGGKDEKLVDAFLKHAMSPRVETSMESPFSDVRLEFAEMQNFKKALELKNFKQLLESL